MSRRHSLSLLPAVAVALLGLTGCGKKPAGGPVLPPTAAGLPKPPPPAIEATGWAGVAVVKRPGLVFTPAGGTPVPLRQNLLTVAADHRDEGEVVVRGKPGRVPKSLLVPLAEAEAYFTAELAKTPSADLFVRRGLARRESGRLDDALADYDLALGLDERSAAARIARGNIFRGRKLFREAVADYDAAIAGDPLSALAYLQRGLSRSDLGERNLAVADCDRSAALDPADPTVFQNRGSLHLRSGDLAAAEGDYSRALELDPSTLTVLN